MKLEAIKEKINDIERNLLPQPEGLSDTQFKDAILLKYTWHVINSVRGILTQDNAFQIGSLKHFLKTNWELVKGSLLSYTALSMHSVTDLLCDIAKYVAENEKIPAINFLMPGIACDSLSLGKYGNLDEMDLTEVLRTYVLGKDSTYLIPISVLAKEEIDLSILNPYFDLDIHDKNSEYLSREELKSLAEHSSEASELYMLREDYTVLSNDKLNLLGKLKEFVRGLGFYSVKGIGEEEVVGDGGYALVINFIEFWNTLDKKEAIPDVVKKEIELIVQMGTDKDKNEAEPLEGCFATRRTNLFAAMKGNQGILGEITLSSEKKASGIEKTINGFNTASVDLQQRLKRKVYTGQDRLGITVKILNELGIALSFANFSALAASLKGLRAEEVSALCALPQAPEKIVAAIANVENLVILASVELNEEVLSVLLQGIQAEITSIIKSKEDFLALLISLTAQQCKVVCNALKEYMTSMVQTANDFLAIVRVLVPDQCVVVFKVFEACFSEIIKTGRDLSYVLQRLTFEQRIALCETFKARFSEIIKTGEDFCHALQHLTLEQRAAVYESFKVHFSEIIKTGADFQYVLKHLTYAQRTAVYESFKVLFPEIIKTSRDFYQALDYLTLEQRAAVFEVCKAHFPEIIKTARNLGEVLSALTTKQCSALLGAFKVHLYKVIKTSEELGRVFQYLMPERRTAVYEIFKARFPEIIKTGADFMRVISYLTLEQRTAVFESLKICIPEIIKTSDDLGHVLKYLTFEQSTAVCEAFKARFSAVIKTDMDYIRMLLLVPEKNFAVNEVFIAHLSDFLETSSELSRYLTPEQYAAAREKPAALAGGFSGVAVPMETDGDFGEEEALARELSGVAALTSPLRSQGIFRHNESNVVLDQNDAHPTQRP